MKYYKLINDEGYSTPKLSKIYKGDEILNGMGFSIKYHATEHGVFAVRKQWQEVTEREYWQQELDNGRLVKCGYYVNSKHVIHKHSGTSDAEYYINWNQEVFSRNRGNFETVQQNNFYRIATEDEIEYLEYCNKLNKFVTKEEFMESKEFVLPEKWKIKDCKEVSEWASNQFGCDNKIGHNYLCIDQIKFPHNECFFFLDYTDYTFAYYIEITFEQFKTHILGFKENMEDKKLIGYKLNGVVSKEIADRVLKWTSADYNGLYFIKGHLAGSMVAEAKRLDILDKWFTPVYKDINKIPEVNIKGYDAHFTDTHVSFGCQTYNREFVLQLGDFLENSGLKIESKDDIMKVVEYYKNK